MLTLLTLQLINNNNNNNTNNCRKADGMSLFISLAKVNICLPLWGRHRLLYGS